MISENSHKALKKFNQGINTKDILSGDIYTPKTIIQLLANSLNIKGGSLYDPCCGSGAMLIYASQIAGKNNLSLYGKTQNQDSYNTCQTNLALHETNADIGKQPDNTLLHDCHADKKFDYVLTNPPFNQSGWYKNPDDINLDKLIYRVPPKSNANFAWLQHIISSLKDDGKAAVIMPNASLTSINYYESEIRAQIAESGIIEAIITFPGGFFYGTEIPFCVWVLNKKSKSNTDILFIDIKKALPKINRKSEMHEYKIILDTIDKFRNGMKIDKHDGITMASLDEIAREDYILSPNLYGKEEWFISHVKECDMSIFAQYISKLRALTDDHDLISSLEQWLSKPFFNVKWEKHKLTDIYNIFGGLNRSLTAQSPDFTIKSGFLDVSTIIHNPIVPDNFPKTVKISAAEQRKFDIRYGDVLLNRTSENIKQLSCGCVAVNDCGAVYSGYAKRLRPKNFNTINPLYMSGYFSSDVYRHEIERVSTVFTTRASLNNRRLRRINIYFPSPDMQEKIGSTLSLIYNAVRHNKNPMRRELLENIRTMFVDLVISNSILLQEVKK